MTDEVRLFLPNACDTERHDGVLIIEAQPWAVQAWLARVGPAALVCWLTLTRQIIVAGGPIEIDIRDLAARLGVANEQGTARIRRILDRLERFGLLSTVPGGWGVHQVLPPLGRRQVELLPPEVRERYCLGVVAHQPDPH